MKSGVEGYPRALLAVAVEGGISEEAVERDVAEACRERRKGGKGEGVRTAGRQAHGEQQGARG